MAKWRLQRAQRRLWSLGLKHLQVWKTVTSPTLNLGWSKRLYLNFPKADGYSIGIGTFRGGEGQDFKSILVSTQAVWCGCKNQQAVWSSPLSLGW